MEHHYYFFYEISKTFFLIMFWRTVRNIKSGEKFPCHYAREGLWGFSGPVVQTRSGSPCSEACPREDLSWRNHLEGSETEPKTEIMFKQGSLSKVWCFNSLLTLLCFRMDIWKIQLLVIFCTCILFSLSATLFCSLSYYIIGVLTQLENQIFYNVVYKIISLRH